VETSLKTQWKTLKHAKPGQRFEARYKSGQRASEAAGWGQQALRFLRLLVALGSIVVGIVLTVIPGPAILFFLIAGSLLSTESLFVARSLDWTEVKLRLGWSWGKRHWRKLSLGGKIALEAGAVCVVVGLGFASWFLIVR
jgi:hypothetical protein